MNTAHAKRHLCVAVLATALIAFGSQFGLPTAAVAAEKSQPTVSTVNDPGVAVDDQKMSPQEFADLKQRLDSSPDLTKEVTVAPGVKTHVYTTKDGSQFALQTPHGKAPPSTELRAGGCGFLQFCVYLNQTDQRALMAGGAAALGVAICAIPAVGWAACAAVVGALAAALIYLDDRGGICTAPNDELQIRLLPTPGNYACV